MLYASAVRDRRRLFRALRTRFAWASVAFVPVLSGCASDAPLNPSFPLTRAEARSAIEQMHAAPKSLVRPVVVLGGIHDPGFVPSHIADVIRDSVPDRQRIIDIAFFETRTFDSCALKLVRTLEETFPSADAIETVEVDVVAFSMGGLVARHAASHAFAVRHGRRLRIARLFTISSPHRGADLAKLPTLDNRARDMRPGSPFLESLDADSDAGDEYPVFAYVRLEDGVVGEDNAAPAGMAAWWVPSGFTFSHMLAGYDQRILADILRRLRYEEPFSIEPPAPMPSQ